MEDIISQKRLFIGIPLPNLFGQTLQKVKERNSGIKKIRWTPLQNLHVTLHFLGNTKVAKINGIIGDLQSLTREFKPFTLIFHQYQLAPNQHPYMIWATFLKNTSFAQLSKSIAGMFCSAHPHRTEPLAHVTLARFKHQKKPFQVELNATVEAPEIQVDTIVLWESILKTEGVNYLPIQHFNLGKP